MRTEGKGKHVIMYDTGPHPNCYIYDTQVKLQTYRRNVNQTNGQPPNFDKIYKS